MKQSEDIKERFFNHLKELQDKITSEVEKADGLARFKEDIWERSEGGGGRTRVMEKGQVFEKAGVNISKVHGPLPKAMQQQFSVGDVDFFACGLSLVIHPANPMVPTVHANWRYFEIYDQTGKMIDCWFGGGQDLTPHYLFREDAQHFHSVCKDCCDKADPSFYRLFKKRCDDYFWNTHRGEARGVGGIFFDYCRPSEDMSLESWLRFVIDCGNQFSRSYLPIVAKNKNISYTAGQREWQEIRRGRYVEFNLVHDRGTLFGLKTNGRIESILMSLPPRAQWVYDHQPDRGSQEEELLQVLRSPRDWA